MRPPSNTPMGSRTHSLMIILESWVWRPYKIKHLTQNGWSGNANLKRFKIQIEALLLTTRVSPAVWVWIWMLDLALEFWFLFTHILNGRMATLPQTLPRSFRDLHLCFRESNFKTRVSASFREVYFFYFSRSVTAVTPGVSAKPFSRGCVEVCYLYLLVGRAFWQCFWLYWLASQKHILYQSNTFRFRTSQMAHTCDILGWVNHFSWSYLPYKWARGLSMRLRERFASAKLPQRTWTLLPYQKHTKVMATLSSPQLT